VGVKEVVVGSGGVKGEAVGRVGAEMVMVGA
jgi:hypothetical protein